MPFELKKRWASYIGPIHAVPYYLWALRAIIFREFREHGLKALSGFSTWRDKVFVFIFQDSNDFINKFESTTGIPGLVSRASGTILELGPALGNQLKRFDQAKVEHIYGVEPNAYFAPEFRETLAASGLADKYTLINCGAEDSDVMAKHGIVDGSLDTVVSIQVLCSVPDPEAVTRGLYKLLKPGGKLLFWEHTRSQDRLTAIFQKFWRPVWRWTVGQCDMDRDMRHIIKQAGTWENYDTIDGDKDPWIIRPRIWGELVKVSE